MLNKLLLILIGFLIINPGLYAQDKKIIKNHPLASPKGEYEPNTVVFKIKSQFRNHFTHQNIKFPLLRSKSGHQLKITSIQKMFPQSSPPEKKENKLGQALVDISLIYSMTYEGDLPVENAVTILQQSGLVEYAEPLYVNKILLFPDDPYIQPGNIQDTYFSRMKAYEAFEIEEGDTNVVIGIIDTGVKWDHEDLTNNIKYNYADPIDGIDNDGDGYVDNFRGWDLGNNDNNPYASTGNEHGTLVAGFAGATTNNGIGIAGTGFKCKILPLKAATDNPSSSIGQGYPAIIYAADHNCKVINLSWGGSGNYSPLSQDVITYAAINKDVVVIAAAGNDNMDNAYYPASYDYVLSVASTDTAYNAALDSIIDIKSIHATYNHHVDIGAMGRRLVSTSYGGYATFLGGSSYASPLVAGAAGLLRSKYPLLNALQIAELLRVTADPLIDTVAANIQFKNEKMGKGRLNMYRALTDNILPAVRMIEKKIIGDFGEYAFSGDTIRLECNFRNYLQPTNNATVTLTSDNPNVVIVQGDHTLGNIPTLGSINNGSDPFLVYIKPEATLNDLVEFRLGYDDPALSYQDYQYFEISINPTFLDIDTNLVKLTVTSNGRFGYTDASSYTGNGLIYNTNSLLYEGGLLISSGNSKVSDCVRSDFGTVDFDFNNIIPTKFIHSPEADMETRSLLTDTLSSNPVGVTVDQRTYAHYNAPDNKYIVVEYHITNVSGNTIDSLHVGIFTDWDIQNANINKASWNAEDKIGYTYSTASNGIYAGVSLLTNNPPSCFSMDHGAVGGNNINPNDGFPTLEKYNTLANGIARPEAGGSGGYDVSQVVGGLLLNVSHNEKRTIAFAFVVGDGILDLKANAKRAKDLFRSFNTSALPSATDFHYCQKDTVSVTITPESGTIFNFYDTPTSPVPVFTGAAYTIHNAFTTDTIFIKGIDSLFESASAPSKIIFHSELHADFGFAPDTVDLSVNPYAFFVDKSDNASQISWDMGDGNIVHDDPGFLHQYHTAGTYTVILKVTDVYGCEDTISENIVVTGNPTAINTSLDEKAVKVYPNPTTDILHIELLLPSSQNIKINIYNTLGEEIFSTKDDEIMHKKYTLLMNEYQKGMYYARIQIGERFITRTFVVQ